MEGGLPGIGGKTLSTLVPFLLGSGLLRPKFSVLPRSQRKQVGPLHQELLGVFWVTPRPLPGLPSPGLGLTL